MVNTPLKNVMGWSLGLRLFVTSKLPTESLLMNRLSKVGVFGVLDDFSYTSKVLSDCTFFKLSSHVTKVLTTNMAVLLSSLTICTLQRILRMGIVHVFHAVEHKTTYR